jgi:endo-1,4-beta-xylanase
MRAIIVVLLFVGCTFGAVLRDLGNNHGKLIGSCAAQQYLNEQNYADILGQQFSVITPENEMKWSATQPSRGQFTFTQGDAIVNFANAHNQKVRGHNLAWGEYNPSWLTSGNFNATSLQNILKTHIDTVMAHYKGKVICWDVVNEAILHNPSNNNVYKQNVWYPTLPNYIDLAFQWASQADPSVKLFYNDYSAEGSGAKADAVYNLVKSMKTRGIPIHGVGLQYHVSLQYSPNIQSVISNIQRITDLGLEVHITELDVSLQGGSGSQSQQWTAQANVYTSVIKACLGNPKCTAFVTWGFTDKYTWLGSNNQPLLYDTNYQPKPSYNALVAALS